jgi:ATP-dependent Clp protease ATP-binding subunit ClpC
VEGNRKSVVEKAVRKAFPPEFINRVDEQVFFKHLDRDDLEKIIDIELKGLKARVKDAGFELTVTATAKRFVAEAGYDPNYGARPLKRAVQRFIEDPVSEQIITERMFGGKRKGGKLRVSLDKADSCKLQVHFVDHVEKRPV